MTTKKIVHYTPNPQEIIRLGGPAAISGLIDHPDLPHLTLDDMVFTSTVLSIGEHGEFETRNTVYRPKA